LKALFIVPVRFLAAAEADLPDGVVGDSSPSSISSSALRFEVPALGVVVGMVVTVGSAESGPSPSARNGAPARVTCGEGFFGSDFVAPAVDRLNGVGAVEDVRLGGVVEDVAVFEVVGVTGGNGGCGWES
jgi:hypothetical protein